MGEKRRKVNSILPVAFIASLLVGCAGAGPSAISFYDQCATQSSSFIVMAECGKAHRNAACETSNSCSASGNAVVMYVDSLETSVKNREMTEAEAQRKWVDFRMTQDNAARQRAATLAAAPTTCINNGAVTNCY